MCTAILGLEPDGTVLLAGVRDELISRAWQPPARHWPNRPGLIGGRDLQAGGTWLAVAPDARRVACVLNGRGRMAPAPTRRTRGELPLSAAADGKLARTDLADLDPFRLLVAEPGRALLSSWNGGQLAEQDLGLGLHMVVNSGLASDPAVTRPVTCFRPGRARRMRRPPTPGRVASPPVRPPTRERTNWPASAISCPGCGRPGGRTRNPASRLRPRGGTGCPWSTEAGSARTTSGLSSSCATWAKAGSGAPHPSRWSPSLPRASVTTSPAILARRRPGPRSHLMIAPRR